MEKTAVSGVTRGLGSRRALLSGACVATLLAASTARAEPTSVVDVAVKSPGLPELQARAPGDAWQHVCVPPCSRRLDVALDYRVAGDGLVSSDVFHVPPAPRVEVDVTAGSPMLRAVGTIFMIGGVLFGVGGGTILVVPDDSPRSGDKEVVGIGFVAAGVLTAAIGVALRIFAETRVAITPAAEAP
jgi:hypothetical protein